MNVATIIVGLIVFGTLFVIIRSLIKNHKKGNGACSSCSTCPYSCDSHHKK